MSPRAPQKKASKRSSCNELISKLDEGFMPTLSRTKYKTRVEPDSMDRNPVRLPHDLDEKNHSTAFDGESQLLARQRGNVRYLEHLPGTIMDKKWSIDDATIIIETETEPQSFPAFFRSTKTYLFPMLDDQIQYFASLWHNFQDTYGYSLDLATFSQSMAILVAVEWKAISLDAFIMASDVLHKQNRYSSRTYSYFEAQFSGAECDELQQECQRFDKCLLTWELLHVLQEQVPQLFGAARAWYANRQASRALQRRAVDDVGKARDHERLVRECTAQAREYALLVEEHERTAEWHARRAEAYSKAAEESLKILRGMVLF